MSTQESGKLTSLLSLGASKLVSSLLALVTASIIARNLDPAEVGVFSIVVASCAYLTIAGEFGLRSVAMSEGSRRGNVASILGPYLKTRLQISLGLCLGALVVAILWYPSYLQITIPVLLSALVMPFLVDWILLLNRNYHAAGWATASRWIFYLALISLTSYLGGLSVATLAILFTLSWALAALLSWCIVWHKKIQLTLKDPSKAISRSKLLSMGWPVLGGGLITQLMLSADLLWIGASVGKSEAGIYYLASAIITAGLLLANALNQITLARYGALRGKPEEFCRRLRSDLTLVTAIAVVLALGTIFVLPRLIPLIFGDKYQGSANLIMFLAPYLIAYHIYAIYSSCCICLGIQQRVLRGLTSMLVVIPVTFLIAASADNLVAFAYGKCFLFVYATAVLLWSTPAEFRAGNLKYFAAPLALILLLLLWLTPQVGLFETGV